LDFTKPLIENFQIIFNQKFSEEKNNNLFFLSYFLIKLAKMTGPSNWQDNQTPFPPPSLYPTQQQQRQQQQQQQQQQQNFRQTKSFDQQSLAPSLLPLRPLQPNPYPSMGYPIYPYPRNRNSSQFEQSEQDKAENRRTRISRAWLVIFYYCKYFFFVY
jgi:hypothetical protein